MQKYLRFLFGLRKYLKDRLTTAEALDQARNVLKNRIENREGNFLNLVEKGVYRYAKSPYLKLLESKKIQMTDIRRWVGRDGLDKALERLKSEDVYFTVDEYKGKCDVVRKGLRFRLQEKQFDNPYLSAAYEVRSGATRSAGTRIRIDFDYLKQRSFYDAFILNVHDALNSPIANWFPVFPGAPGINSSLRFAHIGNPPKRWFTQVDRQNLKVNWEKRLGTNYIIYMSRLLGVPMAKPEFVDLNNAYDVAKWASDVLNEHPNCVIYTFASSAVRVCMAAREHNLNIKGTRFFVTGEPLSSQKKIEIETMGARAVPIYGISEAGVVAAGCDHPHEESDRCHYFRDTIAIGSYKRPVPLCDADVSAFLFTSLLYESPKILLNVEMGDYGEIDAEPCGCGFHCIGFDRNISRIRSYEKLTGEGVTFVDTDFTHIIEHVLPKRFGGQSTDYQLIEQEEVNGLTRLNLMISPDVKNVNHDEVIKTFVTSLRNAEDSPESWAQSGSQMWAQAGTIRVMREYPIPTKRAKILPFHILKSDDHNAKRRYQ